MVAALKASVAEVAQSGLWHLATQDTSLKSRVEERVEELKGMIEELGANMRNLHIQVTQSKTHGALPAPPSYEPDVPMDLESDTEGTVRAKKRRRVSREGSSVSTMDEEVIEQELFSDQDDLQEKVVSLENKLAGAENTLAELQASEIDEDTLEEKMREVKGIREQNAKDAADLRELATSNREKLVTLREEVNSLDCDVKELAGYVADEIGQGDKRNDEITALKKQLKEAELEVSRFQCFYGY